MTHKLLNVPLIVWGLQLLYVAIALTVLVVLMKLLHKSSTSTKFIVIYVVIVIIVNIIWRIAIKRFKPGWF
ncbi:MAG: hypothetical protein ABI220_02590 [Candidatus Saccharimonadales bacterium]